jgi:hypothetical protein
MRKLLFLLLLASTSIVAVDAGDKVVKGYLLDVACYDRLKPKGHLAVASGLHSRTCLQTAFCARSGYGLLSEDQHFIKFDSDSNERVGKFISSFSKETDIRVTVTGKQTGDTMAMSKIELQ